MLFSISLLWGDTFKHEALFLTLFVPEMGVFGGEPKVSHWDQSGLTRCGQGCRDERNARQVYGGRSEDKKYHLFLAHLPLWHISLARNPPMPKSMFVLDFFGDHRWKWLGSNIINRVSFWKSCPLHISNEWLLGILESKAGQNKSNQDGSDAMNLLIYLCMQPKMGTKDASTRNESHSRSLTVLFLWFFSDLFEMQHSLVCHRWSEIERLQRLADAPVTSPGCTSQASPGIGAGYATTTWSESNLQPRS